MKLENWSQLNIDLYFNVLEGEQILISNKKKLSTAPSDLRSLQPDRHPNVPCWLHLSHQ